MVTLVVDLTMSLDYEAIVAYINNHRKSTLLLLVIRESDCLEDEYKVVRMTKDFFELANISSPDRTTKRIYFLKQIESIEDAKEQLTILHKGVIHITYPTFVQGVVVTFLWMMFYLPYAHRYLLPSQVEPFFPSPAVAGWILIILFITHFLESILVVYKLSYIKISNGTMLVWWILTMVFGFPITKKALHLHKSHRRSMKSI